MRRVLLALFSLVCLITATGFAAEKRDALVMSAMERPSKTNLIFLDACRNDPQARNLAQSMGTRSASVGNGLARLKLENLRLSGTSPAEQPRLPGRNGGRRLGPEEQAGTCNMCPALRPQRRVARSCLQVSWNNSNAIRLTSTCPPTDPD